MGFFYRTCKASHPSPSPKAALHIFSTQFSQSNGPKETKPQILCVETGLKRKWTALQPASNYVQWVFIPYFSNVASTLCQKSSDHERILILQLFKFFDLLSQKQYPVGNRQRWQLQCGFIYTSTSVCMLLDLLVQHLTSVHAMSLGFHRL